MTQAKALLETYSRKRFTQRINLSKNNISVFTDHCKRNRHLSRFGPAKVSECKFCPSISYKIANHLTQIRCSWEHVKLKRKKLPKLDLSHILHLFLRNTIGGPVAKQQEHSRPSLPLFTHMYTMWNANLFTIRLDPIVST